MVMILDTSRPGRGSTRLALTAVGQHEDFGGHVAGPLAGACSADCRVLHSQSESKNAVRPRQ